MEITLEKFVYQTVANMRERKQYSAAKTCLSVLRGLLTITGNNSLPFSALTPTLLSAYEHDLLIRGRKRNTISLYMRTLQNICNRATHNGIAQIPSDLFEHVFTGMDPVQHRAVVPEVIQKIRQTELTGKDSRLGFARDMFMLSFYLCGIPFVDLAHLRKCDMKDGYITYRRRKTKRLVCLQVEPCALKIIHDYTSIAPKTTYLLPIIRRQGNSTDEQRQYESALRLYNKHLKQLSQKLELKINLTSYVARHSWATIAHDIGINIADISAALCHSSEKMTRNYLESFTPDRLGSVNREVLKTINKKRDDLCFKKRKNKRCKIPWDNFYSGSL